MPDLDKFPFTDMLKPAVLVALNTGMRRSEQFGIHWKHVDFERNAIDLPKEICKSKKPRTIPMTPTVRDTLSAWRSQTGGEPDDLVFANADGKEINIKKGFASLLERARIEDFTWHSMRHDFASQLVMKGVDVFVVSKLLGHQDVTTTIKHYAHLSPRIQADAISVLDQAPSDDNVVPFEKPKAIGGDE
jgi:integrase